MLTGESWMKMTKKSLGGKVRKPRKVRRIPSVFTGIDLELTPSAWKVIGHYCAWDVIIACSQLTGAMKPSVEIIRVSLLLQVV